VQNPSQKTPMEQGELCHTRKSEVSISVTNIGRRSFGKTRGEFISPQGGEIEKNRVDREFSLSCGGGSQLLVPGKGVNDGGEKSPEMSGLDAKDGDSKTKTFWGRIKETT